MSPELVYKKFHKKFNRVMATSIILMILSLPLCVVFVTNFIMDYFFKNAFIKLHWIAQLVVAAVGLVIFVICLLIVLLTKFKQIIYNKQTILVYSGFFRSQLWIDGELKDKHGVLLEFVNDLHAFLKNDKQLEASVRIKGIQFKCANEPIVEDK